MKLLMKGRAQLGRVKRVLKRRFPKLFTKPPEPSLAELLARQILPQGVEQVYVAERKVHLKASAAQARAGLFLAAGAQTLPFEAASAAAASEIPFQQAFAMRYEAPLDSVRKADGGAASRIRVPCDARINGLADWTLANSQTLQVHIVNRAEPLTMTLAGEMILPAHSQPYVFRAALAAHRAQATLCVHLIDQATGQGQSFEVPFQPGHRGGKARSNFQEVNLSIPAAATACRVTLELRFHGFAPEAEEGPSFLFLADPEISSDLSEDRLGQPGLWLHGAPVADAIWLSAALPQPQAAGQSEIKLRSQDGAQVTLFSFAAVAPRIEGEYGHGLSMAVNHPGQFAFYLDDAFGFSAFIGTGSTQVAIPSRFLDGQTRSVTVRDASGSVIFAQVMMTMPRMLTPYDVLLRETRTPFPGPLAPAASHRYDALKAHLAAGVSAKAQAQLSWCLEVLEGGYANVVLKPLAFPKVAKPDVSVIIPAHNKVEVTYYALAALLLGRNSVSFEVIVVDDASTDETAELESIVSGITVVRNTEAQRFIRACNAGVAAARGEYVVLLNNDTEPTAGWLDALVDAFGRFDKVGLVGSKLVFPNGKLQDAGGIIWGNGNPWNYGHQQNPWDPRYSYARQVDYLSGAALMTTRAIWDQVGGLSSYLEPMYFEDTDFAFKVREAGYTTWFVPSSVVFHFEGMTSGTDVTAGYKKNQELNRPKFKERWADAFAAFGNVEGKDVDLEKDRGILGRVLFIDYTTPRPDRDAGSYAALQEIRLVQSLGYKVTFVPENLAHLGTYTEALERDGVEVITAPFYRTVEDFLRARAAEFQAVYITRHYVGRTTIPVIREVAPFAKILLNNADLHFLRQLRTGLALGDKAEIKAAGKERAKELGVMSKADLVLSYNEVEHSVIQSHTDGAVQVMKCPWVVETPAKVPPLKGRVGMSFLGSFNHHPNAEGVIWFVENVMEPLGQVAPDLGLSIYGSGMTDKVRALASDRVDPVGFVADVADAYDRHRIFVAPLLSGAGIKGKVLAALAHGVPCVLSPTAAEGVGLRHGYDCMIAATPEDWVSAIQSLATDDALWRQLSDNARAYVQAHFSFETGRKEMRAAFQAAGFYNLRP